MLTTKITILGIFLASLFLGENAIIPIFVLANQGYADMLTVAMLSYLASLSADIFWYAISHFFLKKFSIEKWYEQTNFSNRKIYQFILHKHTFLSITFIKFLVGLRLILTIALVVIKKFSFGKFLAFSAASNVVLIAGLYLLGLTISKGVDLLPIYHGVSAVVLAIILSLIAANVIPLVFRIYISKKR